MAEADDFMAWVSDPSRTNNELFTVEILLEGQRGHDWPFGYVDRSYEAQQDRARERRLNPAHRPALHKEELQALIDRVEKVKHFSGAHDDDRPLRDLQALRFFPALETLNVQSSDVTDLSPIASLPSLTYLSIAEYGDLYGCHPICLAECGEMRRLERLHLALRHPWPDVRAISTWHALIDIRYSGNVLALEGMEPFPKARVVILNNWLSERVALRDLRRVPLMPAARELTIETTASLEGVERYPSVVNLEIGGVFRDLKPLATMENITAVTLRSEKFTDLRPLTQMAKLREIKFVREWPLDLSPLADCPQLRRVVFERCAMMRTEVAALNAGLLPEAVDFLAETPRPLAPLKCYRLEKGDKAGSQHFTARQQALRAERESFFDGDAALQEAEKRACQTAMQAKFDALLGRGWGLFELPFVSVKRFRDTQRIMELVDLARHYSAQSHFPQHVTFIVEPHGDMSEELEAIKARDERASAPDADYLMKYYEPEQVLQENDSGRQQREERYEVIKREHLLGLRGEEADELPYLPEEEPPEADEESLSSAAEEDDDGEGGVAIAPPPPPPPAGAETLSDDLMFYLEVYEDCVVVNSNWADRAQYQLGVQLVVWSAEVPNEP